MPINAQATCVAGRCGRGPCVMGTFDVDGEATFGCEASCVGPRCTLGDGGTVTLTAPARAEGDAVRLGLPVAAAGQSSSASLVNVGVVFALTTAADGGEASGGGLRHRSGLLEHP